MKHRELIKRLEEGSGSDEDLSADITHAILAPWVCLDLLSSLDSCRWLLREVLPGHRRYVMPYGSFTVVKIGGPHDRVLPRADGTHNEECRATLIAILKAVGEGE